MASSSPSHAFTSLRYLWRAASQERPKATPWLVDLPPPLSTWSPVFQRADRRSILPLWRAQKWRKRTGVWPALVALLVARARAQQQRAAGSGTD